MTDHRLSAEYRRGVDAHATGRPVPDVPPERLEALAAGRLPEAEAAELMDQVMAHAELMREFELLRAIHRAGAKASPATRWRVPAALAAAAVLAVVGTVLYRGAVRPERPPLRGGTVQETVALVAPTDGARVPRPLTMVWRSVPDAARYRLTVIDQDGNAAFTSTTSDTTLVIPDSALHAGMPYRWWVETTVPAGVVRAAPERFRLTP
jgi:hypothetical protein